MTTAPLLPTLASTSNQLADIVAAKERAGIRSAVLPRDLISHPIWLHPKTAACAGQMHRSWWEPVEIDGVVHRFERHSEVINPLTTEGKEAASPHGLLRHLDLDVTMALSHAWLTSGRSVELELARVLRFMGYQRLVRAPYDEVRASLRRLNSSLIVLWSGPQRPEHISPIRIVETLDFQVRPGKPTILQVTISNAWMNALKTGAWQQVDLDVYAHLIRTNRKDGLARAIYAYLVTQRRNDGSFEVFKDGIVQRFAPRKPDQRRLRYKDHGNPKSALPRAMRALITAGVITAEDDGMMVRGRFLNRNIPRLALLPRQTALCTADLLGGGKAPKALIEEARPSPEALPTPLGKLQRACHVESGLIDEARGRGWDDLAIGRVLLAAAFGAQSGSIRKPGGWAAKIIREGAVADWQRDAIHDQVDVTAARSWAYGPDGPLHQPDKGTHGPP